MEQFSLHDYIQIIKRRINLLIYTFLILFAVSAFAALNWSSYRATATVQVEPPDIPEGMTVPSGVNASDMVQALVDQRISQIQQKVFSTASLSEIIAKYGLYNAKPDKIADAAAAMKQKIKLEMVGADLANPQAAQALRPGQMSAIAFRLSFDYSDPHLTQSVANDIAQRFIDEDNRQRRSQAQDTLVFLDAQIGQLETAMLDQEKKIAAFREKHPNNRPESLAFNQQMLATTALNIQNVDTQLSAIDKSRGDLRSQLANVSPYSRLTNDGQVMTTPATQLKSLQAKAATLTAHYGPNHPDVIKINRQIEGLQAQVGSGSDTAQLQSQIADTRAQLAAAENAYGKDHPDSRNLRRKLDTLQKRLDAAGTPQRDGGVRRDADNPAYLMLVAQIRSADDQYAALQRQRVALQAQHEQYQRTVAETPAVEQEFAALSRDYDNAQKRYGELMQKKQIADMTQEMEQSRKAERLSVIEPARLPDATRPPRRTLLGLGFVLSLMGGFVVAGIGEAMSRSVHGAKHLASITGLQPLVAVPHIYTPEELDGVRRRRMQVAAAGAVAVGVVLVLVNQFVMPLESLLATIVKRLGTS